MFQSGDIFTTTGVANSLDTLNYRYQLLFEPVKDIFVGKTVLDLACHNGRWSYVSLELGCSHVTGVDLDAGLVEWGQKTFTEKGILPSRFKFYQGNLDRLDLKAWIGKIDIVLCLGVLYFLANPLGILDQIAELRPQLCVIDTFYSTRNVPSVSDLEAHLKTSFHVNRLAIYDIKTLLPDGNRVAYHCYPSIKMLS